MSVWHLAQVREGAEIGAGCVIGRGAYIGAGVRLGRRCKVRSFALLYEPAWLGDGVFVGPAAVFTNDRYPRAVTPDGFLKGAGDWGASRRHRPRWGLGRRPRGVRRAGHRRPLGGRGRRGGGGGGRPGLRSGRPVPARFVRWVGRAGIALTATGDGRFSCSRTGAGCVPGRPGAAGGGVVIPAVKPLIGDEERIAVDRVLRSGIIAGGPEVAVGS